MGSPERLRAQAVRLFALAIHARETDADLSEQLAARAIQLQDKATALEEGKKKPRPLQDTSRQSNIQQEEQVQPDEAGTMRRRSRGPTGKW